MFGMRFARLFAGTCTIAWLAAAPGAAITEKEFLAAVTASHPALVAATGPVVEASAARVQASRLANPSLAWAAERPGGGISQDTASVAWELPIDGRRGLRIEAADEGLTAASIRAAYEQLLLRLEARAAFADWFTAEQEAVGHRGFTGRVEALASRLRRRADAGEESGLTARRLELEAAQARVELARAEVRAADARAAVSHWLPSLPADGRPERPELPRADVTKTASERPDLAALAAEVRQAELETRLARRILAPPMVELGWQRVNEPGLSLSGPTAAVRVAVPLLDRRQADRVGADGRLRVAAARLQQATVRGEAETAAARAALGRLTAEAVAAERARAGAEAVITAAEASFNAGESSLTDLFDSLRAARATGQTAVVLHAEALAAARRLAAATGVEVDGGER
ncbi:MAG: TolC family protein [Acidobacteria bacterium]|nr:TolC family protein [Acidobacteriota bacterium]